MVEWLNADAAIVERKHRICALFVKGKRMEECGYVMGARNVIALKHIYEKSMDGNMKYLQLSCMT